MNSFIKYPGSKWALADWIIGLFPEHHSYLEPFFGSGAILFNKPLSNIETVNDLDDEVINLFECIRRDPVRLSAMVAFTPYARKAYEDAYTTVPADKYERALYFCIRCNMGHGFRTNGEKVGWKNDIQGREKAYALRCWNQLPEQIVTVALRLKDVQIENRPAVEIIKRFNFPNVLIYADPPYMLGTRYGKQYRCEMNNRDHEDLLDVLLKHKGPVVLSGYESDLYNDALRGWHKETHKSYTQTMTQKTEVVWMNYELEKQLTLMDMQSTVCNYV